MITACTVCDALAQPGATGHELHLERTLLMEVSTTPEDSHRCPVSGRLWIHHTSGDWEPTGRFLDFVFGILERPR